jgi:hypothetical protein
MKCIFMHSIYDSILLYYLWWCCATGAIYHKLKIFFCILRCYATFENGLFTLQWIFLKWFIGNLAMLGPTIILILHFSRL